MSAWAQRHKMCEKRIMVLSFDHKRTYFNAFMTTIWVLMSPEVLAKALFHCSESVEKSLSGLDCSCFLTGLLDPLALFELVRFVVMRQRNGIAVFITKNSAWVSNIGHRQLLIRQQGHQTCSTWNRGRGEEQEGAGKDGEREMEMRITVGVLHGVNPLCVIFCQCLL